MASRDDLRQMFFDEAQDLLDTLGEGLRHLDSGEGEIETVHAVFRAVHSIKGGAGAFGLSDLVSFAHLFETVLDGLRSGRLSGRQELVPVLLRAGDCLSDLVNCAREDRPASGTALGQSVAELEALTEDEAGGEEEVGFTPLMLDFSAIGAEEETVDAIFDISFAPHAAAYATGNEPAPLLRTLARMGEVGVTADTSGIPLLSEWDPGSPRLRWSISLRTQQDEAAVRDIFDFVDGICDLRITRPVPDPAVSEPPGPDAPTPPQPEPPAADAEPARPPAPPRRDEPSAQASIRVGLDRVDRLLNLVGEMVVTEAMLARAVADAGLRKDGNVAGGLDSIRQLTAAIQDCVMAIRAQPLKPLFQRMHRITREAGEASGKTVRLVTQGEWTEVDKTVVERLADPLTHMIRNSVDHGIESPERRRNAGKPVEGTITLSAAHRSGRVVIEVTDDGAGIDRPRVRAIAVERGLVPAEAALTPAEIDNLLFLPGFSSKAEVSALSGRGVGLDVVRSEIAALGGRIGIVSVAGQGAQFSITLPLTLAVLEGMLVDFGGQTMVVPLQSVSETVQLSAADLHGIGGSVRFVRRGGAMHSVVPLARVFGLPEGRAKDASLIFVEGEGGRRAAFVVDRIVDQRQVVIKPMEGAIGPLPAISAATILGDGRIALIIDPEAALDIALTDRIPLTA